MAIEVHALLGGPGLRSGLCYPFELTLLPSVPWRGCLDQQVNVTFGACVVQSTASPEGQTAAEVDECT